MLRNSIKEKQFKSSGLLSLLITILRAENIERPEAHFYYVNSINGKLYQLFLNEYIFFLSLERHPEIADFGFLANVGDENLKIGLLDGPIWAELIKGVNDILANKILEDRNLEN